MEFRSYSAEPIELRQLNGEMRISGYAAVYNSFSRDMGGMKEIIKPGAFDKSLDEVRNGKREVVARFNHQGGFNLLASTKNGSLELRSDSKGLHYDARLLQTQASKDAYSMIQSGLISGSSFAFNVTDIGGEHWTSNKGETIRELRSVNLVDVAPCEEAAYEAATVQTRSMIESWKAFIEQEYLEAKRQAEEIEKESL